MAKKYNHTAGLTGAALERKLKHLKVSKKNQSKKYTRSKVGNLTYVIFLMFLGMVSMLPFIYCIATSFKPLDELLIFPPRFLVRRPTMQNYLVLPSLLSNLRVPLSKYIFNSVFTSVVTTALYVVVSSMAAFTLSKSNIKGKKIFFLMVQFALLFNAYTLAIPRYLIYSNLDMIDTYWVYILPMLSHTMGVFLMKQYMEGAIPNALLEAAMIDGASTYRVFWQIVLPIVKPCLMTLTLFGFRDAWAQIPGETIFNESLKTLPTIMSQVSQGGIARSGSAMAITVIMMIPPIIVYLVSQSNVLESMNSAGIKE